MREPYIYIEKIISEYKNDKIEVLDYCCGTGNFSIYPALQGHKVYGIDISNKSVEIAKKKIKQFNLNNCNLFS